MGEFPGGFCPCGGSVISTRGGGPSSRLFTARMTVIVRLFLALTFATVFGVTMASAAGLVLVTKDEVRAEEQAAIKPPPRARLVPVPGAPQIRVLQPVISGQPLQNPVRIELQFISETNVEIDPESFRAYYGFLRIDLTERILKNLSILKSGLTVEHAEIPPGSHRLFLRISDSKQRTGETELRFAVE